MPYARKTLAELINEAVQDILTANLQDGYGNVLIQQLLQKAVLRVLATVLAGAANEEYGFLDEIALQSNPATATGEFALMWGSLKGVYPEDAVAAVLSITFGGTNTTDIPPSTPLTRNSDGFGYATTLDAVVTGGVATVTAQATTPGSAGNCAPGTAIAIANSIPGVNATGMAVSTITVGTDQETESAYKTRYLAVYADPPQGGATADYIEWAEQVPGVTRAWVNPNGAGAGTVVVYVMLDLARATNNGFAIGSNGVSALDNNGAPRAAVATGDQLEVANYICGPNRQPVTALVYVCAPTPDGIAFAIAALGAANTTANQALISASLAAMLEREGSPLGQTIYPSSWNAAIAAVSGVTTFNVTSPAGPVVVPVGSLPTLGALTFSS